MSEEGQMNGARRGLRFFARCAREAWRGSWNVTNAWQLVPALLLLTGGAWLAGVKPHYPDIPYSQPIGMGLFMCTAWFAVFLVQLVTAPPRLARLDTELPMLNRRPTTPPVMPILALPAPEPTAAVLPPPDLALLDLPLLDRPPLLPPLLDLSSLGSLPSDPPPPDLPLLDRPPLLPPLLDLTSLGSLPSDPPPPDLPLLDRPPLLPPLLDLASLGSLPSEPPSPDLPLLDRPPLLPPLLDLASLGSLPPDPPPPDLPLLDRPPLLPPLLDLASLGSLPSDPPPPDLPLLDRPPLLPPLLDLASLGSLPSDPPPPDLPLLDRPPLLPPLLDLASLDLAPPDPGSPDLPLSDPPSRDLSLPDLPPPNRPPRHRPLRDRPSLSLPLPELRAEPPVGAPPLAHAAPRPVLPTLEVRLHDQIYETNAVDAAGDRLPASRTYRARIANRSDQTVRRCQLFFCNPTNIQVVSGPFDLAPDEHLDLPALHVIDEADEPHALLYFLDAETWQVAQGQAAWLPEPGRFKVKVLSANAPPSALEVTLSRDAGMPFAWTLVEATEPDKMPKAGRKPLIRASFDAVPEPSLGD